MNSPAASPAYVCETFVAPLSHEKLAKIIESVLVPWFPGERWFVQIKVTGPMSRTPEAPVENRTIARVLGPFESRDAARMIGEAAADEIMNSIEKLVGGVFVNLKPVGDA